MIAFLVACVVLSGITGYLIGEYNGLRLERTRALRTAARLRHPSTGGDRQLRAVPEDGA